jgi:hypothetical protein
MFQGIQEENAISMEPDWNLDEEDKDSDSLNLEACIECTMIDTIILTNDCEPDSAIA